MIVVGCLFEFSMGITMEENEQSVNASDGMKKLSRRKRYMAFPEGSSFSVRITTTSLHTYLPTKTFIFLRLRFVVHSVTLAIRIIFTLAGH